LIELNLTDEYHTHTHTHTAMVCKPGLFVKTWVLLSYMSLQ